MSLDFPRFVSRYAERLPLAPDMEAVLVNPNWTAGQVAAWRYWWPWSEGWS